MKFDFIGFAEDILYGIVDTTGKWLVHQFGALGFILSLVFMFFLACLIYACFVLLPQVLLLYIVSKIEDKYEFSKKKLQFRIYKFIRKGIHGVLLITLPCVLIYFVVFFTNNIVNKIYVNKTYSDLLGRYKLYDIPKDYKFKVGDGVVLKDKNGNYIYKYYVGTLSKDKILKLKTKLGEKKAKEEYRKTLEKLRPYEITYFKELKNQKYLIRVDLNVLNDNFKEDKVIDYLDKKITSAQNKMLKDIEDVMKNITKGEDKVVLLSGISSLIADDTKYQGFYDKKDIVYLARPYDKVEDMVYYGTMNFEEKISKKFYKLADELGQYDKQKDSVERTFKRRRKKGEFIGAYLEKWIVEILTGNTEENLQVYTKFLDNYRDLMIGELYKNNGKKTSKNAYPINLEWYELLYFTKEFNNTKFYEHAKDTFFGSSGKYRNGYFSIQSKDKMAYRGREIKSIKQHPHFLLNDYKFREMIKEKLENKRKVNINRIKELFKDMLDME